VASETTPAAGLERTAPGAVRVRRALLSVSEKAGIVDFARGLTELGVEIVSTGGTARELAAAGLPVRAVEDFTGFPEMMDGRVKTLHPRLYAGLLALRDEDEHLRAAAEHAIEPVDLVCVNLYPFERTVARGDATPAEAIENIDIGGPTMIRAAAKNHPFAAVVVDPADYEPVLAELRDSEGRLSLPTRERLAAAAFACTARYDAAIAAWFAEYAGGGTAVGASGDTAANAARNLAAPIADASSSPRQEVATQQDFPAQRTDTYVKQRELRYGENPHQRGAYYAQAGAPTHLLAGVRQLHGKELSFNNLLDLSSARELVEEFAGPACAIVKHNNPCGCALGESAQSAYERAFACDPQSAYGGVIALNRPVDRACAEALSGQFVEVLLAPGFDPGALEVLQEKKNVRLLACPRMGELAPVAHASSDGPSTEHASPPSKPSLEAKPVIGGLLVQDRDAVTETRAQMRVLSAKAPSEEEWEDMLFAWRICRHVRSNAIVIAAGQATIGIGAGQMSRVDAVRIAVEKGREFHGGAGSHSLDGAVLASDAYFPFPDGPQLAIDAGVAAIIQPAGSVRDELVIAAADEAGVAMVATDVRHFRH
jgi:phosphoribosylaminoimidazolecarboxamide formyltransferase/IMP cyclohydrolase